MDAQPTRLLIAGQIVNAGGDCVLAVEDNRHWTWCSTKTRAGFEKTTATRTWR